MRGKSAEGRVEDDERRLEEARDSFPLQDNQLELAQRKGNRNCN